jgi:hypothetical protein
LAEKLVAPFRGSAEPLFRALPTAALLAAAWAIAWRESGSILAGDWLPYAMFAALLLVALLVSGGAVRPASAALVGLAGLLALAFWTALSLTWSPVPSLARDEALLILGYAVAFAVPLVSVTGPQTRLVAAWVFVAGTAAVTVATAMELVVSAEPAELYRDGRLFAPIGYWNAQAAFFLLAFWPAVVLAARRSAPVLLRGGAFGAATAFLAGWLLVQSKGAAVGLIVSACVFFALVPQRMRALVPTVLAAGLAAGAFEPLTEPFRVHRDGLGEAALEESIGTAGEALLWLIALATAVGLVYAVADRAIDVPARARRGLQLAVVAALVASAAAGLVGFAAAVEHPVGYLQDRWETFKQPSASHDVSTHLVDLGSNRYDFWRVALEEFREHPVAGIGARGWGTAYLKERESDETPRRSHSLELDQLSETGMIGVGLLALALGPPLWLIARRALRDPLVAALAGAAAYWLVHASGDWLWTSPAVGLPFFVVLGMAVGGESAPALPRALAVAAASFATAIAVLLFMPTWLATRFTTHALSEEPRDAAVWLHWSRRLDPLSIEPLVAQAELAQSPAAALPPLRRAVEKQPRALAPHYLLGLAYLEAGRRKEAVGELRTAQRLSPRSDTVQRALERALPGRGASP